MTEERKSIRKVRQGRVISDRMQKTITVEVEKTERHPLYGRVIRQRARFKAHDPAEEARPGDVVRIEETRPISREKRWRLIEIVRRAEQF